MTLLTPQLQSLIQLLQQRSLLLNLFSAGDREKLESKHLPDALAALDFHDFLAKEKVLDLGTGGGIPGLALAVACPQSHFSMMDSVTKKMEALHEITEELGLTNVDFLVGRIEDFAHEKECRGQFDTVTARAVAPLPVLLEYASGFLKVGGQLIAWKGPEWEIELESSKKAQEFLQLEFKSSHSYKLPSGEERHLLKFVQKAPCPWAYPRKVGDPKKFPLV
jgi:16S rRNA (guanine527-N7)-methyltransferase